MSQHESRQKKVTAGSDSVPVEAETTFRLMERARAGDGSALDLICERFIPRLQRWARGRLPPAARDLVDTDDIVQEILTGTIRRINHIDYEHSHALQAYTRRSVDYRIRRELQTIRPPHEPLDAGAEPRSRQASPLEQVVGRELYEQYEAGLAALCPRDQEVIVARMELDYSLAEVAEIVGLPSADAARKAVKRALMRLARKMKQRGPHSRASPERVSRPGPEGRPGATSHS